MIENKNKATTGLPDDSLLLKRIRKKKSKLMQNTENERKRDKKRKERKLEKKKINEKKLIIEIFLNY